MPIVGCLQYLALYLWQFCTMMPPASSWPPGGPTKAGVFLANHLKRLDYWFIKSQSGHLDTQGDSFIWRSTLTMCWGKLGTCQLRMQRFESCKIIISMLAAKLTQRANIAPVAPCTASEDSHLPGKQGGIRSDCPHMDICLFDLDSR